MYNDNVTFYSDINKNQIKLIVYSDNVVADEGEKFHYYKIYLNE